MRFHDTRCALLRRPVGLLVLLGLGLAPTAARSETDWVLLLDRSESMTQNDSQNYRYDAQKIMADLLAQGVGEIHRLTIIRFAGTPEVVLNQEEITPESLTAIRQTISNEPPQGDTDIGAALELARKTVQVEGRSSDVKVVLLSDGVQAGRIEGLTTRLAEELRVYQELGLAVNTIVLNDFSISDEERNARRGGRYHYDDKTLRAGEDLLRDISRKTRGRAVQVTPAQAIEDILLNLISPYMSFYREAVTGRIKTYPTDRQLFFLFNRSTVDVRFRIANEEFEVDLRKEQLIGREFELRVNPYSNRSVVMIRPAVDTRWPEWIDVLPGPSRNRVEGDVFAISNVRLAIVPGFGPQSSTAEEGVKTRVRENELYPILFRISIPADVTSDRKRLIEETLKDCTVRIAVEDGEGKQIEQSSLPATSVYSGTGNRLFFVPTTLPRDGGRTTEARGLTVRASLEYTPESGLRSLARAADRSFVVIPSGFEWVIRRNWKGEPESSSRPASQREIEVELGQEFRLEVLHTGTDVLGNVEILADYSKAGQSSARKLVLRDMGGIPRTFRSDWIFPPETGEYSAKVTLKSDVVQEVNYAIRVVRDDFRPAEARYRADGTDSAAGANLGVFLQGEVVAFQRERTIDRLTPDATERYWRSESSEVLRSHVLRKDPSSGDLVPLRQIQLTPGSPTQGAARVTVPYSGEIAGLEAGDYVVLWPDKRPVSADVPSDPRADSFRVLAPPMDVAFADDNGNPLKTDNGKVVHEAGKKLTVQIRPSATFPTGQSEAVTGTLTWARKDVGAPQVVKALRATDELYTITFPTTDFHTGAAKLQLVLDWQRDGRTHTIERDFEVMSLPKALGLAMEPIQEDIFLGQREAKVGFRIRAIGGQTSQVQRDLMSLWLSHPANVTIGESEQIYRVNLETVGDALVGSIDQPDLPPGSYKLVVSSPVAKLGQDIAACFFNVKAVPYGARMIQKLGPDEQQVLLEQGLSSARCRGEGVAWITIDRAQGPEASTVSPIASAEVRFDGEPPDGSWSPQWAATQDGGRRSSEFPLEELSGDSVVSVSATDEDGRTFDWTLGTVAVAPVPLSLEVVWTQAPQEELGRGSFCRISGAIRIQGATRAERQKVRDKLVADARNAPFLVVTPASVLESFQVIPGGEGPASSSIPFGEQVSFEAALRVSAELSDVRGQILIEIRDHGGTPILADRITVGLTSNRLMVGRPKADDPQAVMTQQYMPLSAKERVRVVITDQSSPADTQYQVEIFEPSSGAEPTSRAIASSDSRVLDWTPRKSGTYRISARATSRQGTGWNLEEALDVIPALSLQWGQETEGALKLDAGQYLPLMVKVVGPPNLDWDVLQRLFSMRAELVGRGGQSLAVDFSPWVPEKATGEDALILKAFSTKPVPASAARARLFLEQGPAGSATQIDVLEMEIVRGGGSIVIIENFDQGPDNYELRDLPPGFELPRGSTVRFGYRTGTSLGDAASIKNSITATIVPQGATAETVGEKVLDVESVSPSLVVFTPYEAREYGYYKIHLEIKDELTQLQQEPEFQVVKGFQENLVSAIVIGGVVLAGIGAVIVLLLMAKRGQTYQKDRRIILDRVRDRKDKAVSELEKEPSERLTGEVRISVSGRTLGPIELRKSPSAQEVATWVDQHFSQDTSIFSDESSNRKRKPLVLKLLSEARTQLFAEAERRLPVRAADVCVSSGAKGVSSLEATIVHDAVGSEHEGLKTVLSIRVLEQGKIRVTTASGKTTTLGRDENFPFNGWIGKSGDQIRASVKIPGIPDYSTVTIDLK